MDCVRPSHALVVEFGNNLIDKVPDRCRFGFTGDENVIEAGNGPRDLGCFVDADVARGGLFQDETSIDCAVCVGCTRTASGREPADFGVAEQELADCPIDVRLA